MNEDIFQSPSVTNDCLASICTSELCKKGSSKLQLYCIVNRISCVVVCLLCYQSLMCDHCSQASFPSKWTLINWCVCAGNEDAEALNEVVQRQALGS